MSAKQMMLIYQQVTHFYMQYENQVPDFLRQNIYEQYQHIERFVELLTNCDQALISLDETLALVAKNSQDQEIVSSALTTMRQQYQRLLEHIGVDGAVINKVDLAIEAIHGQYRQLRLSNRALFFAQLENIHDQVLLYIRNYTEVGFIARYLDLGFEQVNTLLRLTLDNTIYRKEKAS
ncbi:hypothetical protein [Leuconostoc citreum]|uniref:hypothetical protein n=1 Tax=Leuconostoc citreum TaxID=33964 RepID=UPI002150CE4D|nr:hypothetical protein [Leuconostoc citreum]